MMPVEGRPCWSYLDSRRGYVFADSGWQRMPSAEFFTRFGLFVRRDFLDRSECARLRTAMRAAARAPATVRTDEASYGVDDSWRRTQRAEVEAWAEDLVNERLEAARPAVAEHFQVPLTGCQQLQFLVY